MKTDFTCVVDSLPALVWTALPDGLADFVNKPWREYTGFSLEEACGHGWMSAVHPDDLQKVLIGWQAITASRELGQLEARLRRVDGVYRWFVFRAGPISDPFGAVTGWCGVNTDIEDRKRAEEALLSQERRTQSIINGLPAIVAPGSSLANVLEALCDIAEDTVDDSVCSILLVDPGGERLQHGAGPRLPPAYNEILDGAVIDSEFGPCCMAARLHSQVIASDVACDPRWQTSSWPKLTLGFGLRSCWSTPVASGDGRVLGVLTLYQRVPRSPTPLELELISRFAHLASSAIVRVQSDAALKQSEARKAAILDSAFDAVVTIDRQGRITEFNPAAERTFGYRLEQVRGEPLADLIVPPLRDRRWQGLERYLATGGTTHIVGRQQIEMTAVRVDGSEFPIELTITRNHLDGPPSFTGLLRDISERKRSEEELRHTNMCLAEAQKLSRTGSFRWNFSTDGHIWSDEVKQIFGYDLSVEPDSPMILNSVHTDDMPLVDQMIARASAGLDFGIECRVVLKSGATKYINVAAHRFEGEGSDIEYIGAVQDVTERRRSEEALRRSEALLTRGQSMSATGSYSWMLDTDEIQFSEELHRIFEFELDAPVTLERIASRVHPDDIPLLNEAIESARAGGGEQDYEIRLLMPDGSIKYVHTTSQWLSGPGRRSEMIGAVQNITERRVSEETLSKVRSELTRMARITSLGALTASIAHEVSQPLSGIITNANTCLKMLDGDPPNVFGAQETARRTVRDGNRAADVIKRLRALFAKKGTTCEPVDLNELAREVIALCLSDLQRSSVKVRSEFAERLPFAAGDRVQLQQVILNLLLNAAEATNAVESRARQVLIRTGLKDDDHVYLSVEDSGIGFDSHSAEKLFEAFYTTKTEGMGIGLSVSRTIVENHGGRLWAKPNDGPGATFAFSVPRRSEDAAAPGELGAVPEGAASDAQRLVARR